MDLGTAVRTIRKEKGISQKELASKASLSVNALCQIETNNTFPQKSTIRQLCEALGIPVSYLLFFSINENDIPEENRHIFRVLSKPLKELLI